MKKHIVLCLLSFVYMRANDVTSHTYLSIRPNQVPYVEPNLMVHQHHDTGRTLKRKNVHVALWGGRSTKHEAITKFLLPRNKIKLIAKEYANSAINDSIQDLIGSDFNLESTNGTYEGRLTFEPKHSLFGIGFSYTTYLSEKCYARLLCPMVQVRTDMNMLEEVTVNGGIAPVSAVGFDDLLNRVGNMTDAFKQKDMLYGKIDGKQKKIRIADITLLVGYDCIDRKDMYMSHYGGIIFPTGNKPKATYLFEPICGNGGHLGVLWGSYSDILYKECKRGNIWLNCQTHISYLFENSQKRSLDLTNRPWSRYIAVYENDTQRVANVRTWGINHLTQDVRVKPGFSGSFGSGLGYVGKRFNVACGYQVHARQAEKIRLKNKWMEGPQVAAARLARTNIFRSVNNGLEGMDANATNYLVSTDLDLASAAQPATVSHEIHTSLGWYCPKKRAHGWDVGASYEFSRQNTALNRWTLWGKTQVSF